MSCLVIGGGKSVSNYPKSKLAKCAKECFTFAVNNSAFDFPCDVVVATDYQWIKDNESALQKLGKPIITREWDCLKKSRLRLLRLNNDIVWKARLSGQVAVKIADSLAKKVGDKNYCIGLDHTDNGHYWDPKPVDQSDKYQVDVYKALDCSSTVNLGGVESLIECWPKEDKLPKSNLTAEDIDRYSEILAANFKTMI